jgi:hypothetical protein
MYNFNDTPISISLSADKIIYYKLRAVHRRHGNAEKCIWIISVEEEVVDAG